jgi:WD40 repeat protein
MDLKVSPDGNSAIIHQTPLIQRPGSGNECPSKSIIEKIKDEYDFLENFVPLRTIMSSHTVTIINLATGEVEFYSNEKEEIRWISITTQNANHILVGNDDTIDLFDLKSLSKVALFEIPYHQTFFAQSWDSRIVATRGDCHLSLWDMPLDATGQRLSETNAQSIDFIEISADSSLVHVSRYKREACEISDSTGSRLALPIDAVESIRFSPHGNHIALGLSNKTCQLWSKSMTAQLFPDKKWQKIIFSTGGTCIALIPTRGDIEVVDGMTLEFLMACERTSDLDVGDIELSPDGRTIGISYVDFMAENASIESWSVTSAEPVWRQSSPIWIYCLSYQFSPDNKFFAFCWGDREAEDPGLWIVLDLSTFEQRLREYTPVLVFHSKGHLFAMIKSTDEGERHVEIRETASMSLVRSIECDVTGTVWMAFVPSGGLVLSDNGFYSFESKVLMLDIEKGSAIGSYTIDGKIRAFWISEDGYLNCSTGRLPLPSSRRGQEDKDPSGTRQDDKSLLYLGHEWIYRGLKKIMRLPPTFVSSKSVLNGNTLAIAYENRDLRVIKFDLETMPVF